MHLELAIRSKLVSTKIYYCESSSFIKLSFDKHQHFIIASFSTIAESLIASSDCIVKNVGKWNGNESLSPRERINQEGDDDGAEQRTDQVSSGQSITLTVGDLEVVILLLRVRRRYCGHSLFFSGCGTEVDAALGQLIGSDLSIVGSGKNFNKNRLFF